ncbi:MAG: DegV family protein [Clostridia bacterium]|nr:DegV family protein [Clostridia bacterium]
MSNFIIVTDSSCDLSAKMAEELQLHVVPLSVQLDGKTYTNYLDWREISPAEFYGAMRAGAKSTTAAPNVDQFATAMEEGLSQGKDVLYIGFSSGLSGTFNAGRLAAEEMQEKYPDRKIYAIDTLCAAEGEGLLCWYAAHMRDAGKSIEEVRDWVKANMMKVNHWVTVDDLKYLRAGGRISATTAVVGTMLNIKPIIRMDENGKLESVGKVRGRKAAIKALFEYASTRAVNPQDQVMFINHAECEDEAVALADMLKTQLHVKDVVINTLGPVIGSHTGPGLLVVFFLGEHR